MSNRISDPQLLQVADSALQRFSLGGSDLELLREEVTSQGVSKRQIYRARAADGLYLLRVYRPSFSGVEALMSSEQALWSQLHWLDQLGMEQGLAVPTPVKTIDDHFLERVEVYSLDEEGSERPRIALVQSYLSGEEVNLGDLGEKEVTLVGALIARLHGNARGYRPPQRFLRPTWDWEHIFGPQLRLWRYGREYFSEAEMEVLRETARIAWWELKALGRNKDVFGIIHRDLQPTNFLFEGEGKERSVSVVDFDVCGWGYYLYDLALPMFAISNRYGAKSETAARLKDALVGGYESQSPLPPGYERYMDTFLMMRRVSRISIVLWQAVSRGTKLRPQFLSESVDLLGDYNAARKTTGKRSFLLQKARVLADRTYGRRMLG